MKVFVDGVLRKSDDGRVMAKMYAHYQFDEASTIKDEKHCREIVRQLCGEGIEDGAPPEEAVLFRVWIDVTNTTRRHFTTYRANYERRNGCPNALAEAMMEVYAAIKGVLRTAKREAERIVEGERRKKVGNLRTEDIRGIDDDARDNDQQDVDEVKPSMKIVVRTRNEDRFGSGIDARREWQRWGIRWYSEHFTPTPSFEEWLKMDFAADRK